jgi:hypothetical protein
MKMIKYLLLLIAIFGAQSSMAQQDTSARSKNAKVPQGQPSVIDSSKQIDAIDILRTIFLKNSPPNARLHAKKLVFSVIPGAGYSLSTGFAIDLSSNLAFYTTAAHHENLSAIDFESVLDTHNQKIFESRSQIWFDNNDYKLTVDLRWKEYPTTTYGLGTSASAINADKINYEYYRISPILFKRITGAFYAGAGFTLDKHYNITQSGNANGTVSDFTKYGFTTQSTSSGTIINLLFDNRLNPINPLNGAYASLIYRDDFTFLGSDSHWQQLSLDLRKYFKVSPDRNNNILAFWSILAFTNGNAPYLDIPYTAWDTYNNSGRGYAEQRFRGKDELYLEGEFRFGITKNGLLGGAVFTNAESFSEYPSNKFVKIAPAAGAGIRIKINKHSDTNVAIDYAYGIYGSRGLFVNLGENF